MISVILTKPGTLCVQLALFDDERPGKAHSFLPQPVLTNRLMNDY